MILLVENLLNQSFVSFEPKTELVMRVENFLLDSTEMNQLQSHLISRQEVPSDTFKKLFSDERSLLNFRAQELKVRKIFFVFMFNF